MPTLRARLENHPSDCVAGAALATRVGAGVEAVGPAVGALATAASFGSCGAPSRRLSEGARGGLTWEGMVPGARASESAASPWLSPPSESPVLASGTRAANTLCMPPSMPVLSRATGVPFEISLAVSAASACCFSRTASATSSGMA